MSTACVVRAACALASITAAASAAPFTITESAGNIEATAAFAVDPGDPSRLIVTLSNSSMSDVLVPADILTSVFFAISSPTVMLSPVSAVLAPGSGVIFGGTDPGGVVGGEWAYRAGLTGVVEDASGLGHGISSSGLDLFGNANFPGGNLQGPKGVGGMQYGILSAGDDPATGNAPVTGPNAFIKHSVVFTLGGLPEGFDPSSGISDVMFQYGTSLSEPRLGRIVPAPGMAAMVLGVGCLAVGRRRRR